MGRARDISKVFSTGTALATDSEVSGSYLTQSSASTVYQTKATAGLTLLTPTSIANTSGTASIGANGTITFSAVSNVSLNGIFSATYANYRVVLGIASSGGAAGTRFRFRSSGTDNTGSNYYVAAVSKDSSLSTINNENADPTTSYRIGTGGNNFSAMSLEVYNPFASDYTSMHSLTGALTNTNESHWFTGGGGFSGTTSFDGITFFLDSGTLTGTVSVYGYNK